MNTVSESRARTDTASKSERRSNRARNQNPLERVPTKEVVKKTQRWEEDLAQLGQLSLDA